MMLDGRTTTVRVSLVNHADAWMERRRVVRYRLAAAGGGDL